MKTELLNLISRAGLAQPACRLLNSRRRRELEREWLPRLYAPREQVEAHQLDLLRRLLQHARQHVPYYRDLFASLEFEPSQIESAEDLRSLPPLTKDIIRREGERMLADNFSRDRLQEKSTGGSTGEPLVFYRHAEYLDASQMGTWRNLRLYGWRPGDPIANFWGINDPDTFAPRAVREQINLGMYTFNAFDAGGNVFPEWLERLTKIKPAIIYGYASTVWLFCKWLECESLDADAFRHLKAVALTAERLHDFQRDKIHEVLQVPITNLYGSTEIQNVAFTCPQGLLHIAADFAVVETGGESGNQLILTSLHNYAMPFIRYVNGDEGTVDGDACECGINTPCMGLDLSRSCDHFTTASGRMIHGEFFTHMMEGVRGIDTFQFKQTSLDQVELLLVRGSVADADTDRRVAGIPDIIRHKTDGELNVIPHWVESIPPTPMGKHIFTISELETK